MVNGIVMKQSPDIQTKPSVYTLKLAADHLTFDSREIKFDPQIPSYIIQYSSLSALFEEAQSSRCQEIYWSF